ncbi:hypothetical protein EDB19DRAFT_1907170 [Suillus lakei]|nr:hypothetical protein EDB19DRAFT_1907170 [Suillus lakei]
MARPSLEHHWKSKINDDEWEKHRKTFVDRLSNTNIAAGLVLTTSAVFVSTQPPLTSFLPYTIRACYVLALGSFAHALGGLLSGLAVVNIYEACLDGHTLSTVLYTSIHQLADYIPHHFYPLFDVM